MRNQGTRAALLILSILFGVLGPAIARACPGRVLFADNFLSMDPAWGKPSATAFVTPNHAFGLAAAPRSATSRLNLRALYRDVDICVSTFVSMTQNAADTGGLIFWATDDANFYFLAITGVGTFEVLRSSRGRWSTVIAPTKTSALKTGKTVPNNLQVSLVGNQATITINSQQLGSFTGDPPAKGGYIGLQVAAASTGVTAWGFFNLNVTDPTSPASAAASPAPVATGCPGGIVYSDNFRNYDVSAWGPFDVLTVLVDSTLVKGVVITANPGAASVRLNTGNFGPNVDVCLNLSAVVAGNALSGGGLIFWAADAKDYYVLLISDTGLFAVYRQSAGQWSTPLPWAKSAALKTGVNVPNDLQVNLAGNEATILINGQQAASFTGSPPQGVNHIGLLSQAGPDAKAEWVFSQLTITNPAAPSAGPPASPAPMVESASTCPGKFIYADDFESYDASAWGPLDNMTLTIYSGTVTGLILAANPGTTNIHFNSRSFGADIDVCVGIALGTGSNTMNAGGLIFWGADAKDAYALLVSDSGIFSIYRESAGQWSLSRAWAKSSALKTGENVTNALEVNLMGNEATIIINGKQVTRFTGQPSRTNDYIGLLGEAGPNKGVAWQFSQFSVTSPAR